MINSSASDKPLEAQLYQIVMHHLGKLDEYVYKQEHERGTLVKVYGEDPLFAIFGLDTPLYVAAARGGGVVTSIHREIGDLMEACVREVVMRQFDLSPDQVAYTASILSGDERRERSIDCYIELSHLTDVHRDQVRRLAEREVKAFTNRRRMNIQGIGFELRHCYQSADSKRAQADDAMARHLYLSSILPVMLIFCAQSNRSIVRRYRQVWVLKEGEAAFTFIRALTGYDFYAFLQRHKGNF